MVNRSRKRTREAVATTTGSGKANRRSKRQNLGQTLTQGDNLEEVEPINLGVSEQPQASNGNKIVDFEAILKQANVLDTSEGVSNKNETMGAKETSENIFKDVLGNDDIEVVRCGGDDLSVHIPKQIKDKIWSNQYININLLLKGSIELHELCSGGTLKVSESGVLEKQPKFSKEKVQSLDKWTDAFLIFMSIYFQKHPQKVQELLQYMSVIRDAARKHGGFLWRDYDEQFRVRQAAYACPWSQINSDLWLKTFSVSNQNSTTTQSETGSNQTSNSNSISVQKRKSFRTCHGFNQGYCSWFPCKFDHICSSCGQSSHGAWSCWQQSPASVTVQHPVARGNFRGSRGGRPYGGRGNYSRGSR